MNQKEKEAIYEVIIALAQMIYENSPTETVDREFSKPYLQNLRDTLFPPPKPPKAPRRLSGKRRTPKKK